MAINLQDLKSTFSLDTNPIKAGVGVAIAGIGALVAGIGIAAKATMDWATDLDSLGDIMDGTTDEMAAMAFIARKSGVGTDKLAKGITILNKGLIKADGTLDIVGRDLEDFGVQVLDANGKVRDQSELMGDIAEKYASFSTQQERVNFLTKTFGRSGADLVDFFDTLAAEGGMDKVIQKVKDFGLAIDPDRYEQFNRNLEEMKLIGLGLAVSFTEKLMPAVEKFLGLITNPNFTSSEKLGKIFTEIDTFVGTMLNGFANSINNWVANGGAERLTESMVSWIENVGTDSDTETKSLMLSAAGRLVQAFGNALREVDWTAVQEAMGERIEEMFDANRPRGEDAIADFFDALEVAGTDATRNMLLSFQAEIWNWVNTNLPTIFKTGGVMAANSLSMGWLSRIFEFTANLNNFQSQADDKLRTIAKTFFNRGLGWAQQAARGFRDGIGTILSTVESIVGLINGILRKIRTHFNITFSFNTTTGVSGEADIPIFDEHGSDDRIGGRATGGSVTAGQVYKVNELGRPEYFIPTMDGRVSPTSTQSNPPTVLADESIDALGMIFKQLVLKGTNA